MLNHRWPFAKTAIQEIDRALSECRNHRCITREQQRSSARLADGAAALPDTDFQFKPRTHQWLRFARCGDRKQHLLKHWELKLRVMLRCESVQIYGGLKDLSAIERNIFAAAETSQTPDLWDSARLRIVVPHPGYAVDLARAIGERYPHSIVRCRNYFTNPRAGGTDLYRGCHLELQSDDEEAVEVQIITRRREAVGLLDHSFWLKRRLRFASPGHEAWLRDFSRLANILDARDWAS